MKQRFTLSALMLLAAPALAQTPITITQATYPASASTVERYQDAIVPIGQATPGTGANQTWDFRNLQPTGAPYTFANQPVPANPAFAGAQWTLPSFSNIGNLSYNHTIYYALTAAGRRMLGRAVARQAYSLAQRTGGANDSVVVSAQVVPFGGPDGVADVPLPLAVGARYQQTFRAAVTGTLTVALAGLNRTPFRLVQRYTFVDSVGGWGTARIPVAGRPAGSDALPALLVRSRTIRQDSVYLNGVPAPAPLLAAFGLTQGAFTTVYFDQFWRLGSAQPVLGLVYANRQFGSPTGAFYSVESNVTAARASARLAAGLQAWPNPLGADEPLRLALPGATPAAPVQLTLLDGLGRVLRRQPVALTGGAATLPAAFTADLPAGLYTLTVQQGTERATLPLVRR